MKLKCGSSKKTGAIMLAPDETDATRAPDAADSAMCNPVASAK